MINNYKCSFFFIPKDLIPAEIATLISQPKESQQHLPWHEPSLGVLGELTTTNQDLSDSLENAAFIPRKQEVRTDEMVNPKMPSKQKLRDPIQNRTLYNKTR